MGGTIAAVLSVEVTDVNIGDGGCRDFSTWIAVLSIGLRAYYRKGIGNVVHLWGLFSFSRANEVGSW